MTKFLLKTIVLSSILGLGFSLFGNVNAEAYSLTNYSMISLGNGTIISKKLCIDMFGYRAYPGVPAQLYPCKGFESTSQVLFENRKIKLKDFPNYCLDVNQYLNKNISNGIKVVFSECKYSTEWRGYTSWDLYEGRANLKPISFPNGSSFCLDVPGGQFQSGVRLNIWKCNNTSSQAWSN